MKDFLDQSMEFSKENKGWLLSVRSLSVSRMQDDGNPSGERVSWADVAITVIRNAPRGDEYSGLVQASEEAHVRVFVADHFGPDLAGCENTPDAISRNLLAHLDLPYPTVQVMSREWRGLDKNSMLHLRRHKNAISALLPLERRIEDPLLRDKVEAWLALIPQLP